MKNQFDRTRYATGLVAAVALAWASLASGSSAVDKQLIEAIVAKDEVAVRRALESGADPETAVKSPNEDPALCLSIDSRDTAMLELMLEFGASPNQVRETGPRRFRTPLACSIYYENSDAFDLLLAVGADPDVDLCSECAPQFTHTAFTDALIRGRFPMALELAERTELEDGEIKKLVHILENRPYDAFHPWAPARQALIEWTQEQGIEVIPMRAGEGPSGTAPTCVHSVRDQIEGRAEGSICPGDFERRRAERDRRR